MKTIDEILNMIEIAGKTKNQDIRNLCIICWNLANHIKTKEPNPTPNKTDALIASTQLAIDKEASRIRMIMLNKLKAAPGQPCRDVFKHFLKVKGWIGQDQEPEEWPITHIPTGKDQIIGLMRDVDEFSQKQANL